VLFIRTDQAWTIKNWGISQELPPFQKWVRQMPIPYYRPLSFYNEAETLKMLVVLEMSFYNWVNCKRLRRTLMRPTIYTIAEKAGVSIATVSRALNNSPRVSESTRAKILKIMEDVGYQPSASARGLALNTTETLAIVLPQISGPFFSEFIRGAESVSRQNHYHLLVYNNQEAEGDDPLLQLLPARADGLILSRGCASDDYIRSLQRRGCPFVMHGSGLEEIEVNTILPDNVSGAYQLAHHLVFEHPYRRLAYINGPRDRSHGDERLRGYRQALTEAGIEWQPDLVLEGDFDEAGGYSAMQRLLDLPEPPEAVFASNDQMAIGALAAANQHGLRVPEDIAIAGFDDIAAARYLQPALTTVNQAIFQQGVMAVERLLECVAFPDSPPKQIVLPTTLVVRRSCGCEIIKT
jgi:LacI family transcriptional regulator